MKVDTKRYAHSPRKPDGYRYFAHVYWSLGATGWGFDSFDDACQFVCDQWQRAKYDRHPSDFESFIDTPWGRIQWRDTLRNLVQGCWPFRPIGY